jgi:hypothetical protein
VHTGVWIEVCVRTAWRARRFARYPEVRRLLPLLDETVEDLIHFRAVETVWRFGNLICFSFRSDMFRVRVGPHPEALP